jgi:hypothetical protein
MRGGRARDEILPEPLDRLAVDDFVGGDPEVDVVGVVDEDESAAM